MANNDFYLNFGSNAGPFASKLSDEIKPATESILGLIEALEDYEGTLTKARGADTPLNNLFSRLDQATAQFSTLTSSLSETFNKAITGVTDLREDLSELVTEINKLQTARPAGRRGVAAAAVTDGDVVVSQNRRQQKALADILEGNAITARNALKRVADINNTVSRAATGAADQLQILGKAIRDLRGDATQAREGLAGGIGGGHVIIMGGENVAGAAGNVNVQALIDALARNVGGAVLGQAAAAATDAAADAAAVKVTKGVVPLGEEHLDQPAKPGRYSVLGGESRPVGFDVREVRPGRGPETFREYFQRNDQVRQQIQAIRDTLPQGNKSDLEAYNRFRATGGRQADEIFDRIINSPTMKMDQVRASYPGLQLGALTPQQIKDLPDILRRVNDLQQRQMEHATSGITSLLQGNPWATFQGGAQGTFDPTKEVGNIIGRAIRDIDERILSGAHGNDESLLFGAAEPGAEFRRQAREKGSALRRIDFRSDATGEYGNATVTEANLKAPRTTSARLTEAKRLQEQAQFDYNNAAEADREAASIALQSANDNLAAVRSEASEMRKARESRLATNKAATQAYLTSEKTPEQIRAQAERAPQVAQISAQIRQLQEGAGSAANDADVARILGIQPTETRDVIANDRGMQALQERANASGLRNLLQSNPDVVIGRLAQEQEDFLRRFEGLKSAGEERGQRRESLARLQDPEQAAAEADRILQERMRTGMSAFTQAQTRHGIDITEDQHAEAVGRLEERRQAVIQQEIERLTAAGAVAAEPTPVETVTPRQERADVTARRIFRGERADESTPASEAKKGSLQGRFFFDDAEQAREWAGPGGRVVSTEISQEQYEAARARAVEAKVLEGLVVPPSVARQARPYGEAPPVITPQNIQDLGAVIEEKKTRKAALADEIEARGGFKAAESMEPGPERDELVGLRTEFNALRSELKVLNPELHAMKNAAADAARAEEKAAAAGAGGGDTRPPRPPRPPSAGGGGAGGGGDDGGDDEEEEQRRRTTGPGRPRTDFTGHVGNLQEETQADLAQLRAQLELTASTEALTAEQREAILQTAARFRADPAVQRMYASTRNAVFSQATGLEDIEGGRKYTRDVFRKEGYLEADPRYASYKGQQASSAEEAAAAEEKLAQAEELATARTIAETNAILRLIAAQDRLGRTKANPNSSVGALASAQREVNAAEQALNKIRNSQDEQDGGLLGRKLFGQRGFIDSQLRHFGQAIENIAGYTLVFSGFNQLRELVDTGIQADAAFTKLQGQLDATGQATGNLRTQLQGISSATAQSLPAVVEAASELTGVFQNNKDLVQGTKIAAELANISQGTLSAKEAAVGLRDVTDAYGITGVAAIQQVGDEITKLSQITGVSVKDVMEGTTQLAQEAHQFHLAPRQAAVLSAFVTRSTGETGESAAEQVSRILSQLNVGRVQTALEKTRVPGTGKYLATPEQFASGDIGGVLENLLANFDKLTESQKQAITAMIGTGRQARAFAGLLRDASLAAKEFNNSQGDTGALAAQNKRFLDSLAGTIKSLETDFKNVGATLQQLGVFDILGVFAKTLDEVLKAFNSTFGAIGQFFNSNPITKGLKDIIVLTGEAALAFKVFGGSIGQILGKTIMPGRAQIPVLNRAGKPVLDEATGEAMTQFAPYTFREFRGNVMNAPGGILRGVRRGFGSVADSTANFFVPTQTAARYGVGREELDAMSGGRARFRSVAAARLAQTVEQDASATLLQRASNNAAVAVRGLAENGLGKFRSAISNIGSSAIASTAGLIAMTVLIDQIVSALHDRSALEAANKSIADDLSGKTAADAKAKQSGQSTDPTAAQAAQNKALGQTGSIKDTVINNLGNLFGGKDVGDVDPSTIGGVDTGFDKVMTSTMELGFKRLREANLKPLGQRAKALEEAKAANDKDVQQTEQYIQSLGLNPQQLAVAQNDLSGIRDSFNSSFQGLHAQADGIAKINQLNLVQIDNLNAALSEAQNMTAETLNQYPQLGQSILDQSGLAVGSTPYNQLAQSLGYTVTPQQGPLAPGENRQYTLSQNPNIQATSYAQRLQGEIAASQAAISNANEFLATNSNPGDPQVQDAIKARDTAAQNMQQYRQQLRQMQEQNPLTQESIDEAQGNTKSAIDDLQKSNTAFIEANKHLQTDDPQYLANLKSIQDNKVKIAQLTYESAIEAADLIAAGSNDPIVKANAALKSALAKQAAVAAEPGGGSRADRAAAAQGVAAARLQVAQAPADLAEAQFQASIAGKVQNQTTIQAQINDVLRQENLYSQGTLASQQQLAQLKGQEAQLRAQAQQYAADSYNAGLEEQIATLQARGKAGDLEAAANLAVKEAQRKVQQYLAKPGASKNDAEYKQLVGAVATAQRNAFDVSLQAQLDTLDFEVSTYKISSEAEIEGLRQILKSKQLTLKERRDIIEKIRTLQTQLSQELTGGGFNVPTDIHLPTAYQIRRSLGGGAGGTNVITTTNNNQQVTVNNTVPTTALANAVAKQVVTLINGSNASASRANAPTPPIVGG